MMLLTLLFGCAKPTAPAAVTADLSNPCVAECLELAAGADRALAELECTNTCAIRASITETRHPSR